MNKIKEHKDFSKQIREAREALGLTQEQTAKKMGIPRLSYLRIENGAHISIVRLMVLAKLLKFNVFIEK